MKNFIIILLCIFLTSCASIKSNDNVIKLDKNSSPIAENEKTKVSNGSIFRLGDTIQIGGFEITFKSNVNISLIEDNFSQYYGEYLISIPCHVKNVSGETGSFNSFYITPFAPDGNQTDTKMMIDPDDTLGYDGEMRNGAEKDSTYYIIYKGDGEYVIEFDDLKSKGEIFFNITK